MMASSNKQKNGMAPDTDGGTPKIASQARCSTPDVKKVKKMLV
jgi:hypothetical protein